MNVGSVKPITTKIVMQLLECSRPTAYRKIRTIKATKKNPQQAIITLEEFCNYYEIGQTISVTKIINGYQ